MATDIIVHMLNMGYVKATHDSIADPDTQLGCVYVHDQPIICTYTMHISPQAVCKHTQLYMCDARVLTCGCCVLLVNTCFIGILVVKHMHTYGTQCTKHTNMNSYL